MSEQGTVTVVWDNPEQTILRFDFGGHWTWHDSHQARLHSNSMIEAVPHEQPIGAIMCPPLTTYLPPNTLSLAGKELTARHPRIVAMAMVTQQPLSRVLFGALIRIVPSLRAVYHCVSTLDEARALLREKLAVSTVGRR